MAVDLSYLSKGIQEYLYQQCEELEVSLKPSDAKAIHLMNRENEPNEDRILSYLLYLKQPKERQYQSIKLSQNIYQKFFDKESKEEIEKIVENALEMYFDEKAQVL